MSRITKIQHRRDTAANWTSTNPTLAEGEWGYETDTKKAKIGDGSTVWTSLDYAVGAGITGFVSQTNGTVTTADTAETVVRNITLDTADPSGGADGDVWLTYTA